MFHPLEALPRHTPVLGRRQRDRERGEMEEESGVMVESLSIRTMSSVSSASAVRGQGGEEKENQRRNEVKGKERGPRKAMKRV
jgi:hypothetical protein